MAWRDKTIKTSMQQSKTKVCRQAFRLQVKGAATIFNHNEMSSENWKENEEKTEMKNDILRCVYKNNVCPQTFRPP